MLNWRWETYLGFLALAVLSLALVSILFPGPYEICPQGQGVAAEKCTNDNSLLDFSFYWVGRIVLDTNVVIAFFTGLLFVVAGLQLRNNRQQVSHFERVERSFVFPKVFQTNALRKDGKVVEWLFEMEWENSGNTPALKLRGHCNGAPFQGALPADFNYPMRASALGSFSYLHPGGTMTTAPMSVQPSVLHAVAQKKCRLFFWGWVQYCDVFDGSKTRETRFCWELAGIQGDPEKPDMRTLFRTDHPYNCVDEECA